MGQEEQELGDVDMESQRKDVDEPHQQQGDESPPQLKSGTAKLTVPSTGDLKQTILEGLEKKGDRGLWLWALFILCLTPNILNGFHVSSYVFLGQLPKNYYCIVPELLQAGWSHEEIRNITSPTGSTRNGTCTIYTWNYGQLSELNYNDALSYTQSHPPPAEVNCLATARTGAGWHMYYDQPDGVSIVPEWDLLCERTALRSTVQVALSIGKFVGASTFGVISDKYGRKTSFSIAATLYIVAGLLTTFSPFYALLLLGRIGLGASASGVFYPAFALLTENIGKRHRSWMSIAFNFSYPLGMLCLALAAYLIQPWRDLSLALTVPSFLLVIHLYFLVESPRWLLSKGRERKAYRMVFGHSAPQELVDSATVAEKNQGADDDSDPAAVPFGTKLKQSFSEFTKLYGTPVLCRRALICHFTWCITSLCYYVTALNADNFAANRNVYVATTGSVDIVAYILSMIVLAYFGRRSSSFCFFLYAGVCLLVVLAIPQDNTTLLVTLAMLGRVGITAVYAIVTLHTAELFPTEIRNTALGICSTMAHVGSIAAPYITDLLGRLAWWIPTTICGCSVLLAGALTLLHPETRDAALKDHAQQEQHDLHAVDEEEMHEKGEKSSTGN
ncbi:organic cation transporter protein [Anopheles marshallii]|uniref:organic cation transporter protein n=1 Tax=Anopheles marshallii TaxID=1521116 RepID=UPI00237BD818|nr:organic cation transporter protein [Anopheles marshallii]